MPMGRNGLVLFGHGARDPEWAEPLKEVQRRIQREAGGAPVELAFLEFIEPDLETAVHSLIVEGCARITVLPMFIAQGGHLKRDLPALVDRLRQSYPQAVFELAPAVGMAEPVLAAMAAHGRQWLAD